mmetsp:Transcript_6636/g.9700  ORF Transcript_6636/g.9700 Transcript_6636/m.9700 type:complete len:254 (+) Transcript_6636:441-1202(+)|eukprot:CAMPEP_0195510064 /NCGR_PEP_ID=MMETSP0794_2-20130614/2822_1 /TAXON_ID=515487 /ORGANISM="Stephanopyxis turris, Strain CCMP 815" /LENGTH=253 /DNA_ID=CAMNT_0040637415 /DNA_START=434 /DNA_END=1195 /DNA_ORIENTATION=-
MPDQDSLNKRKFILESLTNFTLELGMINFKTQQISDEPETSNCDIDENSSCQETQDSDDTSVEYGGNREQAQALLFIPFPGMPLCVEDPQLGGQKYDNKNKKLDETKKNVDVPFPESDVDSCHRSAPIFCPICLGDYVLSDRVCWSSNARCHHVYHRDCIVSWLTSKRSKSSSQSDLLDCPSCRQDFVDLQNDHVAVTERESLPNDKGHIDDMRDDGSAFVSLRQSAQNELNSENDEGMNFANRNAEANNGAI